MPIYVYECQNCGKCEDVLHSMAEIDNPSEDTQKQISCCEHTCPFITEDNKEITPEHGLPWKRLVTAANITNSSGGATVSNKTMLAKKQQERKLRSRKNFKAEVLPKMENGADKQHFERKFKDLDTKGLK